MSWPPTRCDKAGVSLLQGAQGNSALADQVGLRIWLQDAKVFQCWHSMWDVIWHGELGSSLAILKAGYNLDSLMLRYQGVDWQDHANWAIWTGFRVCITVACLLPVARHSAAIFSEGQAHHLAFWKASSRMLHARPYRNGLT